MQDHEPTEDKEKLHSGVAEDKETAERRGPTVIGGLVYRERDMEEYHQQGGKRSPDLQNRQGDLWLSFKRNAYNLRGFIHYKKQLLRDLY
jgi:hypothetical protein